MTSKAIVLVSGGIDSATCFSIAAEEYDEIIPIHYDYGQQTADFELTQAQNLVDEFQSRDDVEVEDLTVVDYSGVFSHFAGGVASDRDPFTTED